MTDSLAACMNAASEIWFDNDISITKAVDGKWMVVDRHGHIPMRGSDDQALKFDCPGEAYSTAVAAGMFGADTNG